MKERIKLDVVCYAGYKSNERPCGFTLGQTKYEIVDILDRWYGPDYVYFKINADDGNTYIIKYDEKNDEWELDFYQKAPHDE